MEQKISEESFNCKNKSIKNGFIPKCNSCQSNDIESEEVINPLII
jgi:hypothetical protein